jgi:hypothetical protein
MHKKTITLIKILTALILLFPAVIFAQVNSSYQSTIRNDSLLTSKIFEFDIYLQNTDLAHVMELATFQNGIVVNSAIKNGGTITASIVAGSSQLNAAQTPTSVTFTGSQNCIKLAPKSPPGLGGGTVISTTAPGLRVCRIRLTNTVDFGIANPNFVFNFTASPYNTVVSVYDQTTAVNTTITSNTSHLVSTMFNPLLNGALTAYNMTGAGAYCQGGAGVAVGLDGSQIPGVKYLLYKNASAQGSYIPGTGVALSFGNQTAGTYTSKGHRTATYMNLDMNGSAIVTEDPATVAGAVTGGTTIMSGNPSGLLTLAGHTGAVIKWQSSVNDGGSWTDIVNTATTYTSDPLTQTTWFRAEVQSGACASAFSTHTIVTVSSAPIIYNVSGSGAYCQGGAGLTVTLSGSEIGVNYQLYKDAVAFGVTKVGTGATITWPGLMAGSYTIDGTNTISLVTSIMNGTAVITETPNVAVSVSAVANANPVCAGTTVNFTATPTNGGATPIYQWYVNSNPVGAGLVTYSYAPANGDLVHVVLTSSETCITGSPATSTDITMVVNPLLPVSVTVAPDANSVCAGTTVIFTATPTNGGATPTYQWYVNSVLQAGVTATFSYVPANGDQVHAVLTSSETCTSSNPATSNSVAMIVNPIVTASVSIAPDLNNVCTGTVVTFFPTPTNGGTSPVYGWYVNSVFQGNAAGWSFNPANGDQVYAIMTSNAACVAGSPATSNTVTMSVSAAVAASVSITQNPTPACTGSSITFTAVTTGGGTTPTYQWKVNSVNTGTGSTYTYVPTNNDVVAVTMTSSLTCATGSPATSPDYTVSVFARPVPTVSGPATALAGTTQVYTTEAGMTGYDWTVSAGGTITLGSGTNTVSVLWNTGGAQTVSVNYNNAAGCPANIATVYNVTVTSTPPAPGAVSGPASVCQGTTGAVYSVAAIPTATGYVWSLPTGATITAGSNTNSITVSFSYVATSGNVSVYGTNSYGNGPASANYAVTVHPVPVPTITGLVTVCAGTTGVVYTTEAGMTGYTWTIAGGTITAGAGTNAVTVTWNTVGAQSVSVNYTNANSCSAAAPTAYPVTVNALPVPTITGNISVCAGTTGVVYTTQTGMTGYTWTVSAGGAITAGAGTNAITVTWNTAGAQTVTVNYANANLCTAAAPASYAVTVNALPVPTITGTASLCAGTTGVTYTTQTGMTGYTWTVSAGGTITAGAGTNVITVTWNTVGAQNVTVNYTNANLCTAVTPASYAVTVNALPVPTITGPASVCVNTTGSVYSTQAGMTGYAWTVSAGGTITAGATTNTITVTWSTVGAKTVTVNYTNGSGCTAVTPASYAVTINALPVPTITGTNSVCTGTTGVVYTTQTGMTGYVWTISAGGTITAGAGTNAITVTWNTAGAQNVAVNYVNGSGCTAAAPVSYPVTVNARPAVSITGPAAVCAGIAGSVYTTQAGMTAYTWTVSAGGTITAGATTNAITVTWNTAGAQTVGVNYTNASGCSAVTPASYAVTVNAVPVPTIAGPASVCLNSAGNIYSTQAGMTGYTWTVSAGGTITAGATTNAITVTWTTVGAKTVTVNYTNAGGCAAAAPASYAVTVNAGASPTITGTASLCANSGYYNYTTEAGMTAYIWTVSAGGTITSGAATNQIQVNWTVAGNQTVSVNYTPTTGCPAAAPTVLPVTVNGLPGAAGTITGTPTVCGGTNGVSYSTTTIANTQTYVWLLPAGATIASGAGTTNITVNFAGNASSGAITVYGNNLCGNGSSSPAYNVTVNPLPANAGTITGPASVCAGSTGVTYTVAAIANASSYVWTVPTGVTITSVTNTNTITVSFGASASTGNFSVYGTNSCGNGAASPAYTVTVNPIPPTPVITINGEVLSSNVATGNQWYLNGVAIPGATGQNYTAVDGGDYYCIVTLNGCSSGESNHIWVSLIGISENEAKYYQVYPVPNKGQFTVSVTGAEAGVYNIRIINAIGQTVYETNEESNGTFKEQIDLKSAPNGMYNVSIMNDKRVIIRKILITK